MTLGMLVAYTVFFLFALWPERSGGWGRYIGLAVLGGGVLILAEFIADRIMGPDEVTDPLWQRVARLTTWLSSGAIFITVLWLISRAM